MESLTIALALCNGEGSIEPLRAYHQLLDAGGSERELPPILSQWIDRGIVPPGMKEPSPDRAGTATDTWDVRKEHVLDYLTTEKADFVDAMVEQDARTGVYDYPVTWEIRGTVARRSMTSSAR